MNAPVICWGIFLKKLIGKSLDFIDILIILKKLDTFDYDFAKEMKQTHEKRTGISL
ncbi:hypothetical protein [uncultured Streptococcus sp.]|uniref:hypothetical protein n=1 Tax=uncultured Streptococcus sp. TaxID=83427 RepID=UPI002594314B|nr:hypothetical protein [uncultured Streptococcus sp.]